MCNRGQGCPVVQDYLGESGQLSVLEPVVDARLDARDEAGVDAVRLSLLEAVHSALGQSLLQALLQAQLVGVHVAPEAPGQGSHHGANVMLGRGRGMFC